MWGGAGRVGSKKSKLISAPPRGAGLKSPLIPAPLPLQGRENPRGAKWGRVSQAGRGKIVIPIWDTFTWLNLWITTNLIQKQLDKSWANPS